MNRELVLIAVTDELQSQLTPTTEYKGQHYYTHDDGEHRIIWVLDRPLHELSNLHIYASLESGFGNKRLTLPDYTGKKHLWVRMTALGNGQDKVDELADVLATAPRNGIRGRKPIMADSTTIKGYVPNEIADLFKHLGEGNISRGMRLAGEIVARKLAKKAAKLNGDGHTPPDS
jgi:hypothetical protein